MGEAKKVRAQRARVKKVRTKTIRPSPERLATQRSARVVSRLILEHWKPTTLEVAVFVGLSDSGAARLLYRISEVLPLARDEERRWYLLRCD